MIPLNIEKVRRPEGGWTKYKPFAYQLTFQAVDKILVFEPYKIFHKITIWKIYIIFYNINENLVSLIRYVYSNIAKYID